LGQRPGPGKDGRINAKTLLLVTMPAEKTTNFFFDFDYETCWIRRDFCSSHASATATCEQRRPKQGEGKDQGSNTYKWLPCAWK